MDGEMAASNIETPEQELGEREADINKLMELIQAGCEHEVIRHLDKKQISPESCMELFRDEECQSAGRYRGPVLEAAECGYVSVMNALISRGFNPCEVNLGDDFQTKPIHVGSSLGHLEVVKTLVEEHGVSVDEPDHEKNTSLFYCFLNCNPRTYDIVKYLLESGTSVNGLMPERVTPLQECIATAESTPELCKLLIDHGADVNGKNGCTPLYLATKKNKADVVKVLLDAGADIEVLHRHQSTAFMTAARYNHLPVLRYLHTRGANPEHKDKYGNTALHIAAQQGQYDVARCLIAEIGVQMNVKNKYDETPLLKAIAEVHSDIVMLLLKCGYNPPQNEVNYYRHHYMSRKKGVKELIENLRQFTSTARSLQEICIFAVRKLIPGDMALKTDALDVPNKVKYMLNLGYM